MTSTMGTPSHPTPVPGFLGFEFVPRGLGSDKLTGIDGFSAHQIYINSVVAIVVSIVSLCATFVACYWFIRMKRSFRHILIMMLLVSDIFRTLWYLIHPAIMLSRGTVKSSSKYCQASGFLLAASTEASDFAVLVIALHPALFIIGSRKTVGTGGLYPYRYAVYTFWIVVPVLAGSLAFTNPSGGYVSTGTFCYLPVRPFWYRLGLAWIPRYLILSMICLIYASIFIYLQVKFRGISDLRGHSLEPSSMLSSGGTGGKDGPDDTPWTQERDLQPSPKLQHNGLLPESADAPWTPPRNIGLPEKLQKHGLLPESDDSQSVLNPESPHKHSAGKSSLDPDSPRKQSAGKSSLNHETPRKHSTGKSSLNHESPCKYSAGNPTFEAGNIRKYSTGKSTLNPRRPQQHSSASVSSPRRSSIRGSRVAETEAVRRASFIEDIPDQNFRIQRPRVSEAILEDTMNAQLEATHAAIRRQLRFLCIYPLVYLFLWILPFIAHCLSYSDHYVRHPVYPLSLLSTIILSLRGLVDSLIFCWRETPWRRLPNQKKQRRLRNLRRKSFWQRWWIARVAWWRSMSDHGSSRRSRKPSADVRRNSTIEMEMQAPRPTPTPMWWEVEGRKRRDSVWMGTDQDTPEESDRRKSKETGKASNVLVEVDERGVDAGEDETFTRRGVRAVQRSEEEVRE